MSHIIKLNEGKRINHSLNILLNRKYESKLWPFMRLSLYYIQWCLRNSIQNWYSEVSFLSKFSEILLYVQSELLSNFGTQSNDYQHSKGEDKNPSILV